MISRGGGIGRFIPYSWWASGGIGRRTGLKIPRWQHHESSILSSPIRSNGEAGKLLCLRGEIEKVLPYRVFEMENLY